MVKAKIIPKDIAIKIVCIMAKRKSKYTEKNKNIKRKSSFFSISLLSSPKKGV